MSYVHKFKAELRSVALTIAIWQYIADYIHYYGIPPALSDIRDGMGFNSNAGVLRHLDKLEGWGFIFRYPNKSRGILLYYRPVDILELKFNDGEFDGIIKADKP